MRYLIKEFEKILYSSLVYYPDKSKNIGSTFKVVLPELYYEKFRELEPLQKEIITEFITIFLKRLQKSEEIDFQKIKNGILNLKYEKRFLLTKPNVMNYLIEFFGDSLDPYTDIKFIPNAEYRIEIEDNQIGYNRFHNYIGTHLPIKNLICDVAIRINSSHLKKVSKFMRVHKLGIGITNSDPNVTLFYTISILDGEIYRIYNSTTEVIMNFEKY